MNDPGDTLDGPRPADAAHQPSAPPSRSADVLAAILDQYMAGLNAGSAPDRRQLLEAHPALASQLEACLAGIDFINRATGGVAAEPVALGEFRIVREIGRGGMGVVSEAEQTTLKRRVALKVLRFGVVADQEAMQRFRREAETVARLHHTNIVPIFAVGSDRGVHYYAMQYIEGRSLAIVLAEMQQAGALPAPDDVARWGLQAAEALAHSHLRGVIHRDVKPSNLLLDGEGVVWLTDFGLAKRADEVTLTVRGALIGTPRYMSPEQAQALEHPIDHRTDLYSLGASLYELATGQPVFGSAAPHAVIAQILTEEPARPRLLRPQLPRDLETIIITCLAKVPSERYQTAQALAADLRAVLEDRPIRARRLWVPGRALRFVRARKKLFAAAAIGMAATVLLLFGSQLAWRGYCHWRLGRVVLATSGPPLSAQVFPESGDAPVGEPFEVVDRAVLSLPAGDYRLRVTGHGRLGRTYRFAVNRDATESYSLSPDEGRLLGAEPETRPNGQSSRTDTPIPFSRLTLALEVASPRADFVEWTGQTLLRRDGVTGQVVWDVLHPLQPRKPEHDAARWLFSRAGNPRIGTVANASADLDGDGIRDLIWVSQTSAATVAVSGKDGNAIWAYVPLIDGAADPQPKVSFSLSPTWSRQAGLVDMIGAPLLADVDSDGTPDLIATLAYHESPAETGGRLKIAAEGGDVSARPAAQLRRMIEAVSGRSGDLLWTYPVEKAFSDPPRDSANKSATLWRGARSDWVAIVDDTQWVGLDARTGARLAGPIELGFAPVRKVQHADLDGDGEPDVVAVGPGSLPGLQKLSAFECLSGRQLWSATVIDANEKRFTKTAMPGLPMVVDVDGDGRSEVVVAARGATPPKGGFLGLQMLDGQTGRSRWVRPMRPETSALDGLEQVVDVPDLNGDGCRDLVTVSVFFGRTPSSPAAGTAAEPERIYVDALSGKDGRLLWCWHKDDPTALSAQAAPPLLWGRGPDGWPLLAIALGGGDPNTIVIGRLGPIPVRPPIVHMLELSTGRELHALEGLTNPGAADFDGDGLADFWGQTSGHLSAFRGEVPEAWRALGSFSKARPTNETFNDVKATSGADFNGDGVPDALSSGQSYSTLDGSFGSRTAICRSGTDGRVIWKSVLDQDDVHELDRLCVFPLPDGDLDGDRIPDVIVRNEFLLAAATPSKRAATLPLQALSGRTGAHLFKVGPLPLGYQASGYSRIESIEVRIIEPRGTPDLLVRHDSPFALPRAKAAQAGIDTNPHLARVSGRDGRVVWDICLAEGTVIHSGSKLSANVADLDGDGALDSVILIPPPFGPGRRPTKLAAISLRDGKQLWSTSLGTHAFGAHVFAVDDLDGDGHPEVVLIGHDYQAHVIVTAFDGRDGSPRWTWSTRALYQPEPGMVLADLDGNGKRQVCLSIAPLSGRRRVVILDCEGHERTRREVACEGGNALNAADLDGDQRDELLLQSGDRLQAWSGKLKDLWSSPPKFARIDQILPASQGRPATILLQPAVGLDSQSGRPRWSGQPPLKPPAFNPTLLDPGDAKRMPPSMSVHQVSPCHYAPSVRTVRSTAESEANDHAGSAAAVIDWPVSPGLSIFVIVGRWSR